MLEQCLAIMGTQIFVYHTFKIFILKADLGPQIDFGPFGTFFSTGFGVRPIWFVPLLLLMKAQRGTKSFVQRRAAMTQEIVISPLN